MGCCFSSAKVHQMDVPLKTQEAHTSHTHWSYANDKSGPSHWANEYPNAACRHQSPVDIKSNNSEFNENLEENVLRINYPKECFKYIENNGHTFVVTGEKLGEVTGGPVRQNTYSLLSFHMHWGKCDHEGSEHKIDGKSFAAEIHFVNWNSNKYSKPEEAINSSNHDGLLVLGVLVKVGSPNPAFDTIIKSLSEIKLANQKTNLCECLDMRNLFPNDCSAYYAYDGSLTTPPCNEAAVHLIFQNQIEVSSEQLENFRNLYECSNTSECSDKTKLRMNFRPICELNDRIISRSFRQLP